MTKLFRRAALASAFGLTFMALPAFAQDDADAHAAEDVMHKAEVHEEAPAPEAEAAEEEISIAGQAELTALIFEHMSRGVLAMDGDRDTAELRREVSVWLDRLAGKLEGDVSGVLRSEAALATAIARDAEARAEMEEELAATLSQALEELEAVRAEGVPDEMALRLEEVEDLLDALEEGSADTVQMRELIIDLHFEEPLEEDVRLALVERLIAFQTAHGVVLDFDGADLSQNIHLEGEAPVMLSTLELRTALNSIYEENMDVLTPEGEEAAPIVDVPTPTFIGITLN